MKLKDMMKKFVSRGAVIYTFGSLFIITLSLLLSDTSAAKILSPAPFLCFALFSYIISLGSTLYACERFSAPVARLMHAICYNGGFFAFLLICGIKFVFSFVFTLVFAAVYTVAVVISSFACKKHRSAAKNTALPTTSQKRSEKSGKNAPEPYKNRFS